MSVKVMGIVWESALPQREKYVLLAYADHAHDDGSKVFPSVGLVAHKTGYSTRSIQRITKTMIDKEYMVQEGKTKYGTKLYRIMIDNLPMLPPYLGDDKLSGAKYGGDILSGLGVTNCQGLEGGGDNLTPPGVTNETPRGDIAVSPKPSLTISDEPSVEEILTFWVEQFPDKPQPRPTTKKLQDKVGARSKDNHFQEIWREAMERASESKTCQKESWFDLYYFLHNDVNYQKCFDRWMSWKDEQIYEGNGNKKSEPAGFPALRSFREKAGLDNGE